MTSTPVGVKAVTDDRALSFRGVDHVSLTVSNLNASEQFYTEVLGFMVVLDLGYGLVCMDKATGSTLGLIKHEDGTGGRFSHLSTGLDHLGLTAQPREERSTGGSA
jgi:catechol 2,3-dioxygenase-like lactoylglutathione lyase family enzyme